MSDSSSHEFDAELTRRNLLKMAGVLGVAVTGGSLLAACGGSSKPAASAATSGGAGATGTTGSTGASSPLSSAASSPAGGMGDIDLDAARKEGTLVVWHNDQEPDNLSLLAKFTKATGIKATEQKIAPADAVAKIQLLSRSGTPSCDVLLESPDIDLQLQNNDQLMQYSAPNLSAYDSRFKSSPEGFWTAYFINVEPIIYKPDMLAPDEAPKTYEDILDPKWKNKIEFAGPTSGSAFMFWFVMRDILAKDYWDKLAQQGVTQYASSTAMIQDLNNGNKKFSGEMSIFEVTKAVRNKEKLAFNIDPRGIPTAFNAAAILKSTPRPNAAKAFVSYLLSQDGQDFWNNQLQGSYSALPTVKVPELPDYSTLKLLIPTDMKAYGDPALRTQFEALWTKIVGAA